MKKFTYFLVLIFLVAACSKESESIDVNSTLSGSYSTLLPIGNYLYAINKRQLATFDMTDKNNPVLLDNQDVGFDIENLYYSMGVLFIGSSQNLHIFEIGDDGIPFRKSQVNYFDFENMCSKDPVIVNGNIAYVTLSQSIDDTENCIRGYIANELRIYNIDNLESPILLSTLNLAVPKGLALKDDILFVCEYYNGVSVIDVSDKTNPVKIAELYGFQSYDVIIKDDLLIVVGPTEIREFDISDVENIVEYGQINL
ncbi:MAG: hypothetical protein R2771_11260 [Saprospiraceae bacterium]